MLSDVVGAGTRNIKSASAGKNHKIVIGSGGANAPPAAPCSYQLQETRKGDRDAGGVRVNR